MSVHRQGLYPVSRAYRGFLRFATVQVAVLAYLGFTRCYLYDAEAYSWALSVVHVRVYAYVWASLAVLGAVVLADSRGDSRTWLAALVVWSSVYAVVQALFGLSVLAFAVSEAPGAASGALQWFGLAVVSWLWLRHRVGE